MKRKFTFKRQFANNVSHIVMQGKETTVCGISIDGLLPVKVNVNACPTCFDYIHKRRVIINKLPTLVRRLVIKEANKNVGFNTSTD